MKKTRALHLLSPLTVLAVGVLLGGCSKPAATVSNPGGKRKIVLGFICKSSTNDVFQAAESGAKDAARELGARYDADVELEIRTPKDEDAAKQVEAIEALIHRHVNGIAVSCSEANTVTPAIDAAVIAGIPVMCFDSDAPASRRFAFYGTDERECGQRIMEAVINAMGDHGTVAILGGSQKATNLQLRIAGARYALAKHPNVKLNDPGVFYHAETPDKAVEALAAAQNANPSITGWCMVGGWPLFTADGLPWPAGSVKVAACDALPSELDYLRDDRVAMLFAQDCYGWGHRSVQILLEKIVHDRNPPSTVLIDSLTEVTKADAGEFIHHWDKWIGKK